MKTKLSQEIEHLYTMFNKYTLDVTTLKKNSCPCCIDRKVSKSLFSKPLRELLEDDLYNYFASAISTIGSIEDYKHFLPRILELMVDPKNDFLSDFMCYEKLNYAEWETWPQEEINAINNYFIALFEEILNNNNTTKNQIEEILNISIYYGYLKSTLNIWSESKSLKSTIFIVDGILNGFNFKVNNSAHNEITQWLYSDKILNKIEQTFFNTKDVELANRIAIAHTIIENKYPITFSH